MPRIPVRTEPYTSPSRQHRHYKNKRDQVLRALGKAAYINGSHFAIMWVSARGDVETYASEALQGQLDDWFIKRGITDEAKELVRASRNGHSRALPLPPLVFDGEDDRMDDDMSGAMSEDEQAGNDDGSFMSKSLLKQHASTNTTPLMGGAEDDDVFTDAQAQGSAVRAKSLRSASLRSNRRAFPPLDTAGANELYRRGGGDGATMDASAMPHSAFGMAFRSPFDFDTSSSGPMANNGGNGYGQVPHSAPLRADMSFPFQQQSYEHLAGGGGSSHQALLQRSISASASLLKPNTKATPAGAATPALAASTSMALVETTFKSMAARTAFLEHRFGQLQQGMCKTVAKAWIKIIEPKKQTRCPYNKGEEGKPDWWPHGVRHKEPDHLMKPERHALLLTILRSPRIKVARLQLATAEVVALIKADKVSLLMDVYRVAREEEKMREAGQEPDAPATVAVSTLEGWSEEKQCAEPVLERPASPGGGVEATEDDASGHGSARKRAAPPRSSTPMTRLASGTSGERVAKRRGSSVMFNSYGGASADTSKASGSNDASGAAAAAATTTSRGGNRRSQGNAQTWLLHEATQHGIKRMSVSSHTLSSHGRTAAALTAASAAAAAAAADSKTMYNLAHSHPHSNAAAVGFAYGNGEVQQHYGLITPMTGNTQLMDPAFLTAAKGHDLHQQQHDGGNGNSHDARFPGYMSAPPAGHAHLFPHGAHFGSQPPFYNGHLARSAAEAAAQAQAEEDSSMFGYAQQQQQQQQHPHQQHPQQEQQQHSNESVGGALGLHGMGGVSWNTGSFHSHFTNAAPSRGHEHGSGNGESHTTATAPTTWWHAPSHRTTSGVANGGNTMTADGTGAVMADASFETSFASTADSAGPATPPPGASMQGHAARHHAGHHAHPQSHPEKAHEASARLMDGTQSSMQQGNDGGLVGQQPSYDVVAMNGGDKHDVQQQRQQQHHHQQGAHIHHASNIDAGNMNMPNAFGGWVYSDQS